MGDEVRRQMAVFRVRAYVGLLRLMGTYERAQRGNGLCSCQEGGESDSEASDDSPTTPMTLALSLMTGGKVRIGT